MLSLSKTTVFEGSFPNFNVTCKANNSDQITPVRHSNIIYEETGMKIQKWMPDYVAHNGWGVEKF